MYTHRSPIWMLLALLAGGSVLSACGQKGPLYLPEESIPDRVQEGAAELEVVPQDGTPAESMEENESVEEKK